MKLVCIQCHGNRIERDATAVWDSANDKWILDDVQDDIYCIDCNENVDVIEAHDLEGTPRPSYLIHAPSGSKYEAYSEADAQYVRDTVGGHIEKL